MHEVTKELEGYLLELRKEQNEQRRICIRTRADGAINLATACGLMEDREAVEWQNKFIGAIFQRPIRKGREHGNY